MVHLRYVAATMLIVGSGGLALTSCNKEKQGTEVPAGDDAAAGDAGAADDAASDEPADTATSGEVDHEAMTHGDTADGGDAPAADG